MKRTLCLVALLVAGFPAARGQDAPKRDDPVAVLKGLEESWGDAIVKRDMTVLNRLLADDYVLTTPEGKLASKRQILQSFQTPADPTFVIKGVGLDQYKIRVFGDTAVVSSRFTLKVQSEGRIVETPFRHTDVFVKRAGGWECVARQATRIRQSYGHEAADEGE